MEHKNHQEVTEVVDHQNTQVADTKEVPIVIVDPDAIKVYSEDKEVNCDHIEQLTANLGAESEYQLTLTPKVEKNDQNLPLWLLDYGSQEDHQTTTNPSHGLIMPPSSSHKQFPSFQPLELIHLIQNLSVSDSSNTFSSSVTAPVTPPLEEQSQIKSSLFSLHDVCFTQIDELSSNPASCDPPKVYKAKKGCFDGDSTPEHWYDNLSSDDDGEANNHSNEVLSVSAGDGDDKLTAICYTELKNPCQTAVKTTSLTSDTCSPDDAIIKLSSPCEAVLENTCQPTDRNTCIANNSFSSAGETEQKIPCRSIIRNTSMPNDVFSFPSACETGQTIPYQTTVGNNTLKNDANSLKACDTKPKTRQSNSILKHVAVQKVLGTDKKFARQQSYKKVSIDELVHIIQQIKKPDSQTVSDQPKSNIDSTETLIQHHSQLRADKSTDQSVCKSKSPLRLGKEHISPSASYNSSSSKKCGMKPLKLRTRNSSDQSDLALNDSGVDVDAPSTSLSHANRADDNLSLDSYLLQFRQQIGHKNTAGDPVSVSGVPTLRMKSHSSVSINPENCIHMPRGTNVHKKTLTRGDDVREIMQQLHLHSAENQPWPTSILNEFSMVPNLQDVQALSTCVDQYSLMLNKHCDSELSQEKLDDILKKIELSDSRKTKAGLRQLKKTETIADDDLSSSYSATSAFSKMSTGKSSEKNAHVLQRSVAMSQSRERENILTADFTSVDNSPASVKNGLLGPHNYISSCDQSMSDRVNMAAATGQFNITSTIDESMALLSSLNEMKPLVMNSLKYFTKKPAPK